MAILVIAEHDNATLKGATLNTVSAAQKIGTPIHVLVAGSNCGAVAQAAAHIAGVEKVRVADAPHYAHPLAENLAALVLPSHPTTATSRRRDHHRQNFMPRVAALLDVAQVSDIVAVISPDTFVRPIYAGNALATVQSSDAVKVITVYHRLRRRAGRGRQCRDRAVQGAADSGCRSCSVRS